MHQFRPVLFLTALFTLASALVLIHDASALQSTFDLTKGNSTIWFGGEKIGKLVLTADDDLGPGSRVNIMVHVNSSPSENKVFEGWLIPPIISSYPPLSIGQFKNNTLNFEQYMVNPKNYGVFIVSEEPIGDSNPGLSGSIIGGTSNKLFSPPT